MQIADEEILYVVGEMARLHQEREPGEVDRYSAMEILSDKYQRDHECCFCIMERMQCLVPMMVDDRMRDGPSRVSRKAVF